MQSKLSTPPPCITLFLSLPLFALLKFHPFLFSSKHPGGQIISLSLGASHRCCTLQLTLSLTPLPSPFPPSKTPAKIREREGEGERETACGHKGGGAKFVRSQGIERPDSYEKTHYGELGFARLQDSQQTRNTAYATLETFSPGSPLEDSSSQVEASDQNTRGHQQAI